MKNVIVLTLILTGLPCWSAVITEPISKSDLATLHAAFTGEYALEDAVDLLLGTFVPWASPEARSIAQQSKICTVENGSNHLTVGGPNCPFQYQAGTNASGMRTKSWVISNAAIANELGVRAFNHQIRSQQDPPSGQKSWEVESATLVTPAGQTIAVTSQFDEARTLQSNQNSKITSAEDAVNFTFGGITHVGTFSLINNETTQAESCTLDINQINCAALAYVLGWDMFHNPFNE